jgi:hypothetical protein
LLVKTRQELDALVAKGDSVTPEDVIEGAGALVGAGADVHGISGMLASMPQGGGQALVGWLKQQDQFVQQKEAQIEQTIDLSRHRLGVSAMHQLLGHHLADQASSPRPLSGGAPSIASASEAPSNPMMGGPNANTA